MLNEHHALGSLPDAELLIEVVRLAQIERASTARLIAAIAEVDARRLYLGEGCSSLFVYCTRILRLSEHAAYGRIEAARVSRRFPLLLVALDRGDLTLTSVCLLGPHLNDDNLNDVVARARHRSKREVEELVAALRPRPDAPAVVRRLPQPPKPEASETPPAAMLSAPSAGVVPAASHRPAASNSIQPLAPARYKLQVTVGRGTYDKVRRAQDLLRHVAPSGDLAIVLDRALDLLLADLERKKFAASARPRAQAESPATSRHIPAAVRRRVWERDGGRCMFNGPHGRCGETGFLEFHHVRPFADGGEATSENVELRCRAHNQYEADLFFGAAVVREEPVDFAGAAIGTTLTCIDLS